MTEELAGKLIKLVETAGIVAANEVPKYVQEFLNLMFFEAMVDMLGKLVWFLALYFVVKVFNVVIADLKETVKAKKLEFEADQKLDIERAKDVYARRYHESRTFSCDEAGHLLWSRFWRNLIFISASFLILSTTYKDVKRVGKIVLAPKIYLIQEGTAILKGHSKQ